MAIGRFPHPGKRLSAGMATVVAAREGLDSRSGGHPSAAVSADQQGAWLSEEMAERVGMR
jgi:hypothetical protein